MAGGVEGANKHPVARADKRKVAPGGQTADGKSYGIFIKFISAQEERKKKGIYE